MTQVSLPYSITSVGERAFEDCFCLETSIYLPNATSIGKQAFDGAQKITSVTLNSAVTEIPEKAFNECYGLSYVDLPESVTAIGDSAFRSCIRLAQVNMPLGVTAIGDNAFDGCTALADVYYTGCSQEYAAISVSQTGNDPLQIAEKHFVYAMGDCGDDLHWKLVHASGVLTISGAGDMPDYSASQPAPWGTDFYRLTVEEGVTGLGEMAFAGSSVQAATLPSTLNRIGASAFSGCASLAAILVPEGVQTLPENVFAGCTVLNNVSLPVSLTSVSANAFNGCSGLTRVDAPDALATIQTYAFTNCSGMTVYCGMNTAADTFFTTAGATVKYTHGTCGDNLTWSLDGTALTISGTGAMSAMPNKSWSYRPYWGTDIESVTAGEGVTSIGKGAFYSCTRLSEVTLPESLASVDIYAFYKTTALSSISLPQGVAEIADYAFQQSGLQGMTLPSGLTSVGHNAFNSCPNLTEVVFTEGDGALTIHQAAFSSNSKLRRVVFPSNVSSIYEDAVEGCALTEAVFLAGGNISFGESVFAENQFTSFAVPDGWTEVPEYMFEDNYSLSQVTLPASVRNVCRYAFSNCALTEVELPAGLETIEECAFSYNDNLQIYIPASVTSIDGSAFSNCDNLVIFGESGSYAQTYASGKSYTFVTASGSCGSNLTWQLALDGTLTVSGNGQMTSSPWDKQYVKKAVIGEGVTTLCSNAFYNSSALTEMSLPSGLTGIGAYAFYNCKALTSIALPESLTTIGTYAFGSCSGLTAVAIPESVTSIGDYAFSYCTGLTEINLPNGLTNLGSGAFNCCSALTEITVPGSVKTLKTQTFRECTSLTEVHLENGIGSMAGQVFYHAGLTSLTLPDSMTTFLYDALDGLSSLRKLVIPASLQSIEFYDDDYTFTGNEQDEQAQYLDDRLSYSCVIYCWDGSVAHAYARCTGHSYQLLGGACGENLTWSLDDSMALTIRGTGGMNDLYGEYPALGQKHHRRRGGRGRDLHRQLRLLPMQKADQRDPARQRHRHWRIRLCPEHGAHRPDAA